MPTALGKKLRAGTDAAGQRCSVWDLSVHPHACDKALASAQHKVTAFAARLAENGASEPSHAGSLSTSLAGTAALM